MKDNRKKKISTQGRDLFAGLVEQAVELEVALSEHRVFVAELTGGAR